VKKGVILSAKNFLEQYENWYDQGEMENYKSTGDFWETMRGEYERKSKSN
jgi:hypothetical protein